jgi:AcrR family transcriptional regulator
MQRNPEPDQRRETGVRTRNRLIAATLDLLAARGEDGLTLREITDAAGANVSAVSYHFGSLHALRDTAIAEALKRYLDAQQEAVDALGPESTVEDVASAFARQMIRALAAGGRELDVIRIVARTGIDPPKAWDRFDPTFERHRVQIVRVLKVNLPDVKHAELVFRIRAAAGLLNWLAIAPVGDVLRGKSEAQIERWVVPLIAGAFRGASAG